MKKETVLSETGINTERLELVAGTLELVRAELEDRERLARLINARVPESWPPEFNNSETQQFTVERLSEGADQAGWWCWYVVLRDAGRSGRVLVGVCGFKGKPGADGMVEVGYSVLEEFQREGYATEAVEGLLSWAFSEPEVTRVIAETLPPLTPSIRVLEKIGFSNIGEGSEEGVIRFEMTRQTYEERRR
jgi:ribosomal-protein-alanine N-acetyltransferase